VLVAGEWAGRDAAHGGWLLLASFLRMNARPTAFRPEKILVMKVRLPAAVFRATQQHYRDELLRRLGAIRHRSRRHQLGSVMFCCTKRSRDSNPTRRIAHLSSATPAISVRLA